MKSKRIEEDMYFFRRRARSIVVLLAFALIVLFFTRKTLILTDEHRIYTSLIIELPKLERLIRSKQKNLSQIQIRVNKFEKILNKYTWHLKRLLKTLNFTQNQHRQFHWQLFSPEFTRLSKSFQFHLHWKNLSTDLDYSIWKKLDSNFSRTNTSLNLIYLPIRSNNERICYGNLIDQQEFVIYEFLDEISNVNQTCFQGNFLPVKFFHRFQINENLISRTFWKDKQQSIAVIYLNTNSSVAQDEYEQIRRSYKILYECSHSSCLTTILEKNLTQISIICSRNSSISIQFEFLELFFHCLAYGIHPLLFNCQTYLPYSDAIDWFHPSVSFSWLYTIYFQTTHQRFQTLIAYLRTKSRLPTNENQINFITQQNQLIREKNFYYLIHSSAINFTRMPIGIFDRIDFQFNPQPNIQIETTFYDQWNRLYQPFHRMATLTNPFENRMISNEKYSIVILTHRKRFYQLNRLLLHLNGLIHLDRVLVLFNQVEQLPDKNTNYTLEDFLHEYSVHLPSIHVEIVYLFTQINDLNIRFHPWNEFLRTDAILSLDDDSFLRHDEIEYAFRVWRENRARLIGFISRSHHSQTFEYNASSSCSYSMILTGAAFIHRWYFEYYTNYMSKDIRDYVRMNMNCEDIAMNFLVSYLTKQSPMKIGDRQTFYCSTCQESLSTNINHYQKRTDCLREFSNIYRLMPLKYSIYHIDNYLNISTCFL